MANLIPMMAEDKVEEISDSQLRAGEEKSGAGAGKKVTFEIGDSEDEAGGEDAVATEAVAKGDSTATLAEPVKQLVGDKASAMQDTKQSDSDTEKTLQSVPIDAGLAGDVADLVLSSSPPSQHSSTTDNPPKGGKKD